MSALLAGAMLLFPNAVAADQGVAINLGSIQVDEPLERGGSYRLPVMEVTNPGTEVSAYRMSARPVTGTVGMSLVGDWLAMDPVEFTLEPGEARSVAISLVVPMDAEQGLYEGLIGPSVVPASGGATVGAGAAAKVTFEIPPDPTSLTVRGSNFVNDKAPWLFGFTALIGIVAAFALLRRRFTFRIERK